MLASALASCASTDPLPRAGLAVPKGFPNLRATMDTSISAPLVLLGSPTAAAPSLGSSGMNFGTACLLTLFDSPKVIMQRQDTPPSEYLIRAQQYLAADRIPVGHALSKMASGGVQTLSISAPLPYLSITDVPQVSPGALSPARSDYSMELPPLPLSRAGSLTTVAKPPLPPGAQQKALRARRMSSGRSVSSTPRAIQQQQKFGKMDDPRSLATPDKLQAMTLIELKFMCRTNNWFGFSGMGKQDLIAFILQKVNGEQDPAAEPAMPTQRQSQTSPRKLPVSEAN